MARDSDCGAQEAQGVVLEQNPTSRPSDDGEPRNEAIRGKPRKRVPESAGPEWRPQLWSGIEVHRVGDAVCLTVVPDEGDSVELWLPVNKAAQAGGLLIDIALLEQAERVKRRLDYRRIHVPRCECLSCQTGEEKPSV